MNKIVAINPTTNLSICKNVALDNTYTDTMTFADATAQHTFFKSKEKYFFEQLSPIDIKNNIIRVNVNANNLYDCNYIIFQNSNWSAKYFYAFITDIEYIAPEVSQLTFEIDVIQSWYFDIKYGISYIDREHVNDDIAGHYTKPENLPLGEYVCSGLEIPNLGKKGVITAEAGQLTSETEKTTNGIFSGLKYYCYEVSDDGSIPALNDELLTLQNEGKSENLVSMSMFPYDFFNRPIGDGSADWITKGSFKNFEYTPSHETLDGYTPKNRKLLTFPYSFLYCDNSQGGNCAFRWEFFGTSTIKFRIYGCISPQPELVLIPQNYAGLVNNLDYRLTLSNFPMCSWANDTYRAFLAQNATNLGIESLASMGQIALGGASLASGNVAGAMSVVGGVGGLASVARTVEQAKIAPRQTHGTQGSNTMYSNGLFGFRFCKKTIRREYAKMIDDFFTKFGYNVDTLKTPNITGRASWNFVKTHSCEVSGNIPFNHIAKIKQIFNSGITFWHGDYVGDYSRDNS